MAIVTIDVPVPHRLPHRGDHRDALLLGEGDRVVGVSGYTVRPPEARQKPRVSAFINANFDKIEALRPDLIFAFSDLQADIAAELVRRGYRSSPSTSDRSPRSCR